MSEASMESDGQAQSSRQTSPSPSNGAAEAPKVLVTAGGLKAEVRALKCKVRQWWSNALDLGKHENWYEFDKDYLTFVLPTEATETKVVFHDHFKVTTLQHVLCLRAIDRKTKEWDFAVDKPDKSKWERDQHVARLLIKLLETLRGKDGPFHDLQDKAARNKLTSAKIVATVQEKATWQIMLERICKEKIAQRARAMPLYRPFRAVSKKVSTIINKAKSGPNKHGGQLAIVWTREGRDDPQCILINDLKDKDYADVQDEITDRLSVEYNDMHLGNTELLITETLYSLARRHETHDKPLEEIKVADLLKDQGQLRSADWKRLQKRAEAQTHPIVVQMTTKKYTDTADAHARDENENDGASCEGSEHDGAGPHDDADMGAEDDNEEMQDESD